MVREKIAALIEETARDLGYRVYESSVYLKGENSRVIVRIDSDRAISHNDCEIFSKEFSSRLDSSGLFSNYSLEVSSPGLKRRLNTTNDFRRFAGSPARIAVRSGNVKKIERGTIKDVSENAVVIETEKGDIEILFNSIENSNLDY